MSEKEDKYHDTIPDLEARAKKNEDVVLKMESSPSSSSERKPTVTPMPSENPMLVDLNQMENDFKTLFELLQTNSKRESIFYTSPKEIRLTNFCLQEVKPILHKFHLNFEIFQKQFLKDIKEMKDVFNLTENDLSETWKQNKLLKDQLLEEKIKHAIECCVLLSHECVDNKMQDEIEKTQRDSIEIQEGMQKRINILEHDVQRCQKQSLDFELQLQHEKERQTCESSLKSICENSWISKMENLESENVSLEFQVQSLIKERENVKTEYQKLFDLIKTTRTQTQGEINELIENVNQKTYAYADVVQIIPWIVDSGCSKHMTGDRSLLKNFVEKFMGLGNNLISVGQFCDGDLEVAFHSKTCYVRNLEGDDLLIGDHESNLHTVSISDMAAFHLKEQESFHPPKVVPSNHSKLELLHMDLCGPMRVASINGKRYILVIVVNYSRFTWVYFLRTKDETLEIIKNFIARV
ncbi:integrase, catalytic region, zinc finger, CCHC-type containing protein [Tanacetum coccineum]